MVKKLIVSTLLLLSTCATPVYANAPCASYERMIDAISGPPYKESLVEEKPAKDGGYEQLWANEKTGTWTLFSLDAERTKACAIGSGKGYKLGIES